MANLDPRVEVIREQYGLDRSDFWELPQKKGTWLVKHAALEVVAAKAGIIFEPPMILEANSADGIAAVCVTGHLGDRAVWSIGEASSKNSKNAYPWAMAEKRSIDRVILKLIGIHGLVYSEDEMSEAPEPPKVLVKDQREIWTEMRDELDACQTIYDLGMLWASAAFRAELKKLKPDWVQQLTEHKDARKAELSAVQPATPPNFEGMQ